MAEARILVVEDEESIGQGLCDVLTFRGHRVRWERDGALALRAASEETFDLFLLDVMLPEVDGYTICERLRENGLRSGIIMLTAKGSEEDILRGFTAGADDYVTKPFSLRQLLARVDALIGRSLRSQDEVLRLGSIEVDAGRAQLSGPKGTEELSAKEIGILQLLLSEPGRIVGRRQLLRDVWEMQSPDAVETRTVDVHVAKLRKKLSQVSSDAIATVRGQGYRFVPDGEP